MILVAESGSTKTDWRILGKEEHSFETIGLNPYFITSEDIKKELLPHTSLLTSEPIREVHFYGTGITDAQKGSIIQSGVQSILGENCHVYTYSDVIAAARSLFGNSNGIACILGTGSNSCYWDGTGISFQIPPLGFWLGDEGSGGHLGKSLVLAYLHKEMPLPIRSRFEEIYGAKDRLEILDHAYKQEKPNRYFAQYSMFLHQNQGDKWCKELILSSFHAFIEKYLIKYPQANSSAIGCVGSIAYHYSDLLGESLAHYGLKLSKVVQKPIDALCHFHRE
ncbi:N-acetylglucosamine kinase [Leadbetterella byssophila]|uniref:N-acetylglucosamine kinase n=1 Tax=Leadbetterella byssophila TaxID=316068 RepID=UPI0039A283D5